MSLPWFRLYHRMIDDEKLRLLAFEDRWHFVALCCLKADGVLDTPHDDLRSRKIAVKMGIQLRELDEVSRRLSEVGLIGPDLSPLAWDELQKPSDNSTNRVRAHREKQAKTTVKHDETLQKRSCNALDTDTDTDTDVTPKGVIARKRASTIPVDWLPVLTANTQQIVNAWPAGKFDSELAAFIDHAADKGRTSKDWQAAFRTWINNANRWSKPNGKRPANDELQNPYVLAVARREAERAVAERG